MVGASWAKHTVDALSPRVGAKRATSIPPHRCGPSSACVSMHDGTSARPTTLGQVWELPKSASFARRGWRSVRGQAKCKEHGLYPANIFTDAATSKDYIAVRRYECGTIIASPRPCCGGMARHESRTSLAQSRTMPTTLSPSTLDMR